MPGGGDTPRRICTCRDKDTFYLKKKKTKNKKKKQKKTEKYICFSQSPAEKNAHFSQTNSWREETI
jgi:hypothetical protein